MRKTLLVLLLALVLTCTFAVMAVPGSAASADSDIYYEISYNATGGGGYVGNAKPADLTGGKSLTMEFSLDATTMSAKNFNNGILVGDHLFAANDPYTSGTTFYWHSNWAYFDARHCWAQTGWKIGDIEEAGAEFDDDTLYDTLAIYSAGNHVKIIYTSYTAEKGGSVEIYTKKIGADDSTYTLASRVTNIPKAACPDENAVWMAWYVSVPSIPSFTQQISNFKIYDSEGTDLSKINVGPNVTINKVDKSVEETLSVEYNVTYSDLKPNNYSAWFGSNEGVDLQDGDKLTMQFEILTSKYYDANYNVGFVLNSVGSDGDTNPYSADSAHGTYFYGNPAYEEDNMVGKKAGVGAAGATATGDFNPHSLMKSGNTIKAVYTYNSTGSTLEIYTRFKLDSADDWTLNSKLENITAGPSENVHMYWYTDSSMTNAASFGFTMKDYSMTLNGESIDKSFVSNYMSIAANSTEEGDDKVMMLSGYGKDDGTVGGATWFANLDITKDDSMSFEVANGKSFSVVLRDGKRGDIVGEDVSAVQLVAEKVDYNFYKVEFTDTTATLYGADTRDGDYLVVDTIDDFAYTSFSMGIRVESDSSVANTIYVDDVIYSVNGDNYVLSFNNGVPAGTSVYGTGNAYVSPEMFTVKYVFYDGTIYETQSVGFGDNAKVPAGDWENAEEAFADSQMIMNDTVIYLVREGDNLGGVYVAVVNGTLSTPSSYGESFGVFNIGDTVTVIARDTDPNKENYFGWSNGTEILTTENTYTFVVEGNTTMTAVFERFKYNIKVVGGAIRGTNDTEIRAEVDTEITIQADSKAGYRFGGWSDGTTTVNKNIRYTFTVTGDATYTAIFTPNKYEVKVIGGGIIESLGTAKARVDFDSIVTLVPVAPVEGYTFIGWSSTEDVSGLLSTDENYSFTCKGAQEIYAIWMENPVTVSVVDGTFADGSTSCIVEAGTELTVTPDTAPVGKQFYMWVNNLGIELSLNASYTFTVTENVILTAKYEVADLVINVVDGYIGGEADKKIDVVKYGDTVTVTANAPEFGYVFAGWAQGKLIVATTESYTFTATQSTTLTATYSEDLFTVTVENGLVNGKESANIAYNASVNVIAKTPDYGMYFEGWYVNGEKISSEAKYLLTVEGDVTITAQYAKLTYVLNVAGGTIKGEEGETASLPYLNTVTVIADAPIANYVFMGWSNGGFIISRQAEYSFKLERDTNLTATYAPKRYVVTVMNGTINGMSTGYIEGGKEATVVAKNKAGYTFKGWSNGTAMVSTDTTYTFEVTGTITMTAVYDALDCEIEVIGGTLHNGKTKDTFEYDEEITVKADKESGFNGWYVEGELVSSSATYTFDAKGDVIITAKYDGGAGCGSIAPTDKTNGGNMMIIGILAIALLAIVAMRHSKKVARFAPKALVLVLCVALLAGVVFIPGMDVEDATAADASIANAATAEGMNIVSTESENTYYFPVENIPFGSDVRVTFDIRINNAPLSANENYSITQFWTAADEFIDDALPIGAWTKLTFETKVIAANGGFNVMLKVKEAAGLNMDIKNLSVSTDVLPETLLAGATMWMLPNTTSEQMQSFVVQTASGKVVVFDGGVPGDYDYLVNFLYSLKAEVDHWFISHYHSDHIGALSLILQQETIKIKNLYTNFPTDDYIQNEDYGKTDYPSASYFKMMEILNAGSSVVENWDNSDKENKTIEIDDIRVKILNNVQNHKHNYGNETTINFRMDTGVQEDGTTTGKSVLFLGDSGNAVGSYLKNYHLEDIQGCTFVQAAHHGQNGVTADVYQAIGGQIYLYCAPAWLWNCGSNGIGSGTYNTLVERNWQRSMGTVVKFYSMKDGLVTFR